MRDSSLRWRSFTGMTLFLYMHKECSGGFCIKIFLQESVTKVATSFLVIYNI
jgi:hypothetical protein